jgi:hypothetical protein
VQVAPGEVAATSVALAPCATDAGRLVTPTEREPVGVVTTGVAGGSVTSAVGVAVAAGFVGELTSAMP